MKDKLTTAQLQAARKILEQDILVLKARTDEVSKAKLEAKTAQLEACDANIELVQANELKAADRKKKADAALSAMCAHGACAPQDQKRKDELMAEFMDEVHGDTAMSIRAGASLAKQNGGAALNAGVSGLALAGRVTPVAGALTAVDGRINQFGIQAGSSYSFEFGASGWSAPAAIAGYAELAAANTTCAWNRHDAVMMQRKHDLAVEAANWFKTHLSGSNLGKWEHIPGWQLQKMVLQDGGLNAGDYTSGTLGTLSGTLVLQRCLPNFAYDYPELLALYTDFSDTPGLLNQTETTRIVVQPTVSKFDATLVGGVPNGFVAAGTTGTTIDAPITLTDYIGMPIVVGNNVLASTTRKLFDEQAFLSIKAIAAYWTNMLTNLITTGNYNAYATPGTNATYGGTVPIVYPTYPVNSGTFALSDIDRIGAAFSDMKVPKADRGILLNPVFYAKLRSDPRFYFLFMGAAKNIGNPGDYLGEPLLPRISGFAPYEAAYLPSTTPSTNPTTTNVAGWAFHKAGAMLKSRLPVDFTQAVNAQAPGTITTITDPDTKMSIMLVQYISLTNNYASWRPEVILGAAVGDFRGGLVLTGT